MTFRDQADSYDKKSSNNNYTMRTLDMFPRIYFSCNLVDSIRIEHIWYYYSRLHLESQKLKAFLEAVISSILLLLPHLYVNGKTEKLDQQQVKAEEEEIEGELKQEQEGAF